jgi:hypothetical protein
MMKFARKSDFLIIVAVVVVSALIWLAYSSFFAHPGRYAEIYYDSELVRRLDLSAGETGRFSIEEEPDVAFELYGDGSIAFVLSDCPDKTCVKSGRLSRVGEYAACLPNHIYIKIVSEEKGRSEDPDIIVG